MKRKDHKKQLFQILLWLFLPYIMYFSLEFFTHDPWEMAFLPQLVNYLLFLFAGFFLAALTGSLLIAALILLLYSAFVGMANYFVMAFRNNPILPWDLKSMETAVTVMDNYSWKFNYRFVVSCILLLTILLILLFLAIRKSSFFLLIKALTEKLSRRLSLLFVSLLMLIGIFGMLMNENINCYFLTPTNLFTQWASYRDNGFTASFIQNMQYIRIKKPAGYNKDTLDEELASFMKAYGAESSVSTSLHPDIIVIMNESFSDLSVLHEFETDQDYMPFIHSLQKTSSDSLLTGNLFVSVCGGNTANTEFEFLTGNSMAFLPAGSVAYQQYISGPQNSLASELHMQAYKNYGMHPYNASGWNRNKVYPYLGFDQSLFKKDFGKTKTLRKYVSDESAFGKISEIYDRESGSLPLFFFEVTMQNHGGYSEIFDNCPLEVHLENIKSKTNSATENYLTLIKKTDQAFEEFIRSYEDNNRPLLILMFGDHQPNDYVAEKIAALTGTDKDEREPWELQNRYIVPYVIWSNFPLNKRAAGLDGDQTTLSCNYLGASLMRLAGLKTNDYQDFLLILKKTLPVITANTAIDKDGNYMTIQEACERYPELMNLYQKLQYRELFD